MAVTMMMMTMMTMTMTMTFNLVRLMKIARTTASFVSVIPSVASHASGQRRYIDDDHDDDPFGNDGDGDDNHLKSKGVS